MKTNTSYRTLLLILATLAGIGALIVRMPLYSQQPDVNPRPVTAIYCDDSGTANTYACTNVQGVAGPMVASMKGLEIHMKALNSSTTASTFALNGNTPVAIQKGASATVSNDIVAARMAVLTYDGTVWQLASAGTNSAPSGAAGGSLAGTYPNPTVAGASAVGPGFALSVAHATYSFAVDGGAQGAITLTSTAAIPDNALLVGAMLNSSTACTSGGSATIAIGTTAGSAANSIKTATAVASWSADALLNGTVTFAAPVKMTAAGNINITVATADLTAGIIQIYVFYVVSPA